MSGQLGKCCGETNFHEGKPIGTLSDLYGVNTYSVGEKSSNIIVILTDLFGHKYNNIQLIADEFSRRGFYVLVPDILHNDPFQPESGIEPIKWLADHGVAQTKPVVDSFLNELAKDFDDEFECLGLIGYCFGAKYAIQQLTKESKVTVGAVAHPSLVDLDEYAQVNKPLLISTAAVDNNFPQDLRTKTEDKLRENGIRYQIDVFSDVEHGYACRGDIKVKAVRYAKEKTLYDQVCWLNHFRTAK